MTEDSAKPKRKRWRWLAATLAVLLICGWWFAPRGDTRLIGRWQVTNTDLPDDPPVGFLEFHRDGTVSDAFTGSEAWTTVGSTLFLGAKSDRNHWRLRLLSWKLGWLTGAKAIGNAYRILEVTPDRIELGGMKGRYPRYTCTRLKE